MANASTVFVFHLGLTPPGRVIFHLHGGALYEVGQCPTDADHERWVMRTACGRPAYIDGCGHGDTERWGHGFTEPADRLRRDHAELLGRCCKVCEASRG